MMISGIWFIFLCTIYVVLAWLLHPLKSEARRARKSRRDRG